MDELDVEPYTAGRLLAHVVGRIRRHDTLLLHALRIWVAIYLPLRLLLLDACEQPVDLAENLFTPRGGFVVEGLHKHGVIHADVLGYLHPWQFSVPFCIDLCMAHPQLSRIKNCDLCDYRLLTFDLPLVNFVLHVSPFRKFLSLSWDEYNKSVIRCQEKNNKSLL